LRFFSASSKRWLTTIIQKNGQTSDPTTLSAHTNMTEFDDSFSILWENDVDPAKVTLGLAFYGRSYTLKDASCSSPGCAIFGFGPPGMCDDAYGYESYDQVQSLIDDKSTSTYFDEDAGVSIATYGGYQWMSFENKESFAKKVEYASAHCIGGEIKLDDYDVPQADSSAGLNVWGIDLDRQGHAIEALSNSTKELERAAEEKPDPADPLSECHWTECIDSAQTCSGRGLGGFSGGQSCQEGCPAGTTESWRTYGNGACDAPGKYRLFCCPNSSRPDSCKTRKDTQRFETRCVGRCSGSEVKIGIDTSNCLSGWNEVYCTRSDALTSMQQCGTYLT
jgi:chitinase